jgi:hypothetical protein
VLTKKPKTIQIKRGEKKKASDQEKLQSWTSTLNDVPAKYSKLFAGEETITLSVIYLRSQKPYENATLLSLT